LGFSYTFVATGVSAHEHSPLAGDGGVLSITDTNITGFSPVSLVVALS